MLAIRNVVGGLVVVGMLGTTATAQPALDRLEQQLRDGRSTPPLRPAEPGYLGVITRDKPPPGRYIEVVELVPDAPAARAGIRPGDLIIRVNDVPTRQMTDLANVLNRSVVGERLEFTLLRGQDEHKLLVTLSQRPPAAERMGDAADGAANPAAAEQEVLPAPPQPEAVAPNRPMDQSASAGPILPNPGVENNSRIDLLERRVAELEKRLAELERLLERRP